MKKFLSVVIACVTLLTTGCNIGGHYDKTEDGYAEVLWKFYTATKNGNYTEALLLSDVADYFNGTKSLAEDYPLFTEADIQSICEIVVATYDCSRCHNLTYIGEEKDQSTHITYKCSCEDGEPSPTFANVPVATHFDVGGGIMTIDDDKYWSTKVCLCFPKDSQLLIDGKDITADARGMTDTGLPHGAERGNECSVIFPDSLAPHTYSCTLSSGEIVTGTFTADDFDGCWYANYYSIAPEYYTTYDEYEWF